MGHTLWSLIFVILGLWTIICGLCVASPRWFERCTHVDVYCNSCRKKLEDAELARAADKERYQPRQI